MKSYLEEHEDYLLAETKSEVRKKECRADFLYSTFRDLQRHLGFNRLEIYCTNQGVEESRKEQARLHEELVHRERNQKYSRSGRNKESSGNANSRKEVRESHAPIQELTSQVKELQERMKYINDFQAFQDIESICSGK